MAASLLFLDINGFNPDQAFHWNQAVQPGKYQFQPSPSSQDESVTILLSDSPVLVKSNMYHRYQIFTVDRLIDHSSPSLAGFNLQQQISRFSRDKLGNHEGFVSLPSFVYEYKFQHQLTYEQCQTVCLFQKATLLKSIDHLAELRTLIPRSHEYIWTAVNQSFTNDKDYKVVFDLTEIFPENRFNGNSSTILYHYYQGEYEQLPFADLHGRVAYYTYESDAYYSKQPYSLLARVNIANQWQVLIPQWGGTQQARFGKALCTCVRDLSRNLKNSQRATALAQEAGLRTIRSPQNLEVQRVKSVSPSSRLSNVESILSDQQYFKPGHRSYMRLADIYDLRLEAAAAHDGRVSSPLTNGSRHKRALPLAASMGLGVISKIVQFSLPYMMSDGKNFIRKIKQEIGGSFMRAPQSLGNETSFEQYISARFTASPARITVESDRVKIHMKDQNSALRSLADPSLEQAQKLASASRQLQYIEQNVLPYLPSILLHQVMAELPFPLRPDSQILARVQTSGTFSVVRYFFELHRQDLTYTQVQTFALPFKKVDKRFYSFSILNVTTVDITQQHQVGLKERRCIDAVLTNTASNLASVCPQMVYKPQVYRRVFYMIEGSILVFPGPSSLSLDCLTHPASKISLTAQFNVLYIANSCSTSIHYHETSAVLTATSSKPSHSPYQLLLSANIPELASTSEKIFYWMVGLSITVAVIFAVILFFYFSISVLKLKYKPHISVNEDGIVDVSIKNVQRKLSDSPSIPNLEQVGSPTVSNSQNEPCGRTVQQSVSYRPSQESVQILVEALEPKRSGANPPSLKSAKPAVH